MTNCNNCNKEWDDGNGNWIWKAAVMGSDVRTRGSKAWERKYINADKGTVPFHSIRQSRITGPPECWNVTIVMEIFMVCRIHLVFMWLIYIFFVACGAKLPKNLSMSQALPNWLKWYSTVGEWDGTVADCDDTQVEIHIAWILASRLSDGIKLL